MANCQPVITATIITRNEARCIGRCVASLRPWVDRIVVLDTGSTDETVKIAKDAGAEVHETRWEDSFSIARNKVLDLSKGDWNLVLDADEWIISGGASLRQFCSQPPRLGSLWIEHEVEGATAVVRTRATRFLPKQVRFEGRVHEQAVSDMPRVPLEMTVRHDGYCGAQLRPKMGRNLPLLLHDLHDKPHDAYILYQLAKDAEMRGDCLAAADWYVKSVKHTAPTESWRHDLMVGAIQILTRVGKLNDAFDLAQNAMLEWPESPDVFFVIGELLLERAMAEPSLAVQKWLPMAMVSWQRCLEIGDRPNLDGSVPGRGSHLAMHNIDVIRSQMAMLTI